METLGWGAGGVQALEQDRALAAQTELNRVALGLEQAKAAREEREAALDLQVGEDLARLARGETVPGTGPDFDGSNADVLEYGAKLYQRAGAPARALEYFKAAGDMRQEERLAQTAELEQRETLLDIQAKQSDGIASILGSATDETSWDAGIDQLEASGNYSPEEIEGMRDIPFSLDARDFFVQQALTARERIDIELRKDSAAATAAARDEANKQREIANRLRELTLAETERANRARERNSGDNGTVPTNPEIRQAEGVVSFMVFNGEIPDKDSENFPAFTASVSAIAARAKQLAQATAGVTYQEALAQATIEAQERGEFEAVSQVGLHLSTWFSDDRTTYKPRGLTPDRPLPAARSQAELEKGKYYTLPSGGVGKWVGNGFEVDE